MDFLTRALGALPEAAKSPYAFVAYIVALGAWVLVSLRVTRNKNLLKQLVHLPQRDRLRALQAEMGQVPIREGLSPEQYFRS